MKGQQILPSVLALILLFTLAVGLSLAQGPGPGGQLTPQDTGDITISAAYAERTMTQSSTAMPSVW